MPSHNATKSNWFIYWIGWLFAGVFLVVMARFTTLRFAALLTVILVLLVFVIYEIISRRRWEKKLFRRLEQKDKEYVRLVREIARNRNELSQLKNGLAETGRIASAGAESRMLSSIAERLTIIGSMARPDADDDDDADDGVDRMTPLNFRKSKRKITKKNSDLDLDAARGAGDISSVLNDIPPLKAPTSLPNDREILNLIQRAVNEDRIDVFMQPVVNLPQRKQRFAELLSRIRVGKDAYLPANQYIDLALKSDLLPAIDNLLLLRALQLVRNMSPSGDGARGYFCNITPLTLSDGKFMGDLVEFISQNQSLAPRLIFELSQSDLRDASLMTREMRRVFGGLAELGCQFSMDGTHDLNLDSEVLKALHIRYLKIDAPTLLENISDRSGFNRLRRIKSQLDRNGIDMIVTHIEHEKDLIELLDLEIDYGQGYLFGEPERAQPN